LGCEEGLIPYQRPSGDEVDVDEERRLFYVGMTRAESQLYLSWSKKRTLYGKTLERRRSRFVMDIESRLLKNEKQRYKKKKREGQVQFDLFDGLN
jgi:DNA helicase-2/ATP-dependent DNA helicase PcrA